MGVLKMTPLSRADRADPLFCSAANVLVNGSYHSDPMGLRVRGGRWAPP